MIALFCQLLANVTWTVFLSTDLYNCAGYLL